MSDSEKWQEYARRKRLIENIGLTHVEHARRCQAIIEELGL